MICEFNYLFIVKNIKLYADIQSSTTQYTK
jgi:hypothetical protein